MGSIPMKPPFDLKEFLSEPASPETRRALANRRRFSGYGARKAETTTDKSDKSTE